MEHALGDTEEVCMVGICHVLILIVMEHALGVYHGAAVVEYQISLNPYCNGTCSRRVFNFYIPRHQELVLILIVMEHALGERQEVSPRSMARWRLNPYCNGTCSRSDYNQK